MLLYPAPVPSDRFTYDGEENLLVIEASDLGPGFAFGRVYDEACDVGFTVVSSADVHAVFGVCIQVRDGEGDVLYEDWSLVPESARELRLHARSGRRASETRVRIFND